MSNAIYPTLSGLTYPAKKSPVWEMQEAITGSGRSFRSTYWTYPKWEYDLAYEFLSERPSDVEMQQLAGFFNSRAGPLDNFLFFDEDEHTATDQGFGIGNGSATVFPLLKVFGGYTEPVAYATITNIKVNGVVTTAYTVTDNHIITFTSAPGNTLGVTWTGTFHQRVHFIDKRLNFEKFMALLWAGKSIKFITDKL